MKNFFNKRNKKKSLPAKYVLLSMSAVCVIAILLSLTLNISGGPLNAVAGYVFVPMQEGLNSAGNWISDKVNHFKSMSELSAENEALQAQVDELTMELTSLKLERYEETTYRQLLELDEKYPDYEKVAASVISMDSTNWFDTFTINRGSRHGIDVGMNVMSGAGLVGIVTDVGPNYAKIRSIIDDSSKVSAMVTTTHDNIVVSGNLELMNTEGVLTFSQLKDSDDKVAVGDPVVTSYISDRYHQGILIGYITSIESDPNNLTKSGTITPVVDFEHLQEVLVILEQKDGAQEMPVDDTESTESATESEDSTESDTALDDAGTSDSSSDEGQE